MYNKLSTGLTNCSCLFVQSGPGVVKARQLARTDKAVLDKYGGGDVWPMAAAWDLGEKCSNGNYLENDDIAVSHGVCGDTPQVTSVPSG